MTQVAVNVVRWLFTVLEVFAVPALMNLSIKGPEVSPCFTIIGALEFRANEWFLVKQIVDEDLCFIKDSDMVLLVLDLE